MINHATFLVSTDVIGIVWIFFAGYLEINQ